VQQVSIEVIRAHADAAAALGNLSASAGLLDAAEQAQHSAERRYDKGVGDIAELLTQQGALVEARQERIRCLADWQAARLRLLAAVGVLGALGALDIGARTSP
jgi:outer membrane protein